MENQKKIECEIYDRTVGYFASTKTMNRGKREEQSMRKRFSIEQIREAVNGKQTFNV